MCVNYDRACTAANRGFDAMIDHIRDNRQPGEPATTNDLVVAMAVLTNAVTELTGLSLEDFATVVRAVDAKTVRVQ